MSPEDFKIMEVEYTAFTTEVYNPTSRNYRGKLLQEYLKEQRLTNLQKSVLVGSLLGDGTICKSAGMGHSYYKIDQATTERGNQYVEFLYTIFSSWVGTPPSVRLKNGKSHSIWFRTYRMTELDFWRDQFYAFDANGRRKKQVPTLIHRWLNPIALAIWFMDDGSKNKDIGYTLHVEGFTLAQIRVLQAALQRNFGIATTVHKDNRSTGTLYKLYIGAEHRDTFTSLVSPYILPGFQVKLIPPKISLEI